MVKGIPGVTQEEGVRACEKCRLLLTPRKALKEIIVLRNHNVVHLYPNKAFSRFFLLFLLTLNRFKVVEHGRRFYRYLVFSSDWRYCFHDMNPIHPYPKFQRVGCI